MWYYHGTDHEIKGFNERLSWCDINILGLNRVANAILRLALMTPSEFPFKMNSKSQLFGVS
jgi:hypothetical protein